jgi:hypothetical protein
MRASGPTAPGSSSCTTRLGAIGGTDGEAADWAAAPGPDAFANGGGGAERRASGGGAFDSSVVLNDASPCASR